MEELRRPGGWLWGGVWWRRLYDSERAPLGAWMIRQWFPGTTITFALVLVGVGIRAVC
jgi:hypothetical protein